MKKLLFLLMIISSIVLGQEKDIENKVKKSAKEWINLIDNKEYEISWKTSDILIQNLVSIKKWENLMIGSRNPLGKNISRDIISIEYKNELQGVPDGEYCIIIYNSVFENKKNASETITIKKSEDEKWKVAGYYIK
ncbi:MAG: hypothetical protein CMD02_00460 [Flavobacteriales bacterium]|nr:hypothetical protein [Flavobacteriales bacterium]|tara:strand:+ start:975 stop:1382 length:408 start_codon:yes stop_codon:yes gene_type:complete